MNRQVIVRSVRRLAVCMCVSGCVAAYAQQASPEKYEPVADPRAEVTLGHARITVLTDQMLRLEWAADGKFEDHASLVFLNRRLPVPQFTIKKSDGILTLDTGKLHLVYRAGDDGVKFSADNLSVAFEVEGKPVVWKPGMQDAGNLLGTTRTLDRTKDAIPLEPGLVSRDGWVVVDDSTRPLFDSGNFSFSNGLQSEWPWLLTRPAGDRVDWYFLGYGHDYRQALGDYVRVAGRIPVPPRFAFGVWWSRYWAYSDQELLGLVNDYRERTLPLDVLVIDMDWHLTFPEGGKDQAGQRKGWSGYTWNPALFPDPANFLHDVHADGLKVTLNLHPASGVQPYEQPYAAMAKAMGQDPKLGKYVPFDITDKKFAENYFAVLHHPMEKQGIDFWWLDWQQQMNTAVEGVNPTFWLNYTHFTDQEREGKRPLLFHRWGGLGNHRYEIGFSGDTQSSWPELAYQTLFTSTAANVGYAYWSHDIGGHVPGVVDPELYTRWIQWGAFSPILRTHTTKELEAERRVWAFPEPYDSVMENAMRAREEWIPYLYTEARRTYDTGVAFLHPLYYDWPNAAEAYTSSHEYMFGDKLLIAPVVTPMDKQTRLASEDVWLPEGEWIEMPTGTHLHGAVKLTRSFGLEEVPVYMRPGAIVPKQPKMLRASEKPVDPLTLAVAPLEDGQRSSYTLYEDSGHARDYETNGGTRWTPLSAVRKANVVTVTVAVAEGSYSGALTQHRIALQLPADWPPQSVTVNGKPLAWTAEAPYDGDGWRYDGNTLTTSILTGEVSVNQATTIVVTRDPKLVAKTAELNGFAGKMARLHVAFADTANLWPIDDLMLAAQTGDRIGYHPERAAEEIERLPSLVASAAKQFEALTARATHGTVYAHHAFASPEAKAAREQGDRDRMARTNAMLTIAARTQP
jgi:alpha-glucosidase (family GH31 glycosyl hydrolase)